MSLQSSSKALAPKTLEGLMPGCFDSLCSGLKITGLSSDSRTVQAGDLFFALEGYSRNGSEFAQNAVSAGAVAVASNDPLINQMELEAPVYFDQELSKKTSAVADAFYGHPSQHMDVVGITGTNGKTSCCFWLSWMLGESGVAIGHIGTLGAGMVSSGMPGSEETINKGQLKPTGFTTPDALQTQRLLSECNQAGASAVVMEVSSHALDQGRVAAVHFESAIFTNLSQDHLDYHQDMDSYLEAKLKLFKRPELKRVIINLDDLSSVKIPPILLETVELYRYSLRDSNADIYFSEILVATTGYQVKLSGRWGEAELQIPVLGEYNLSNLLAVCATALAKGVDFGQVVSLLKKIPDVPGRMQRLSLPSTPDVVIDYAHTPDAVSAALQALRPQVAGQLIVVLGCGGERDMEKRPLMAQAAVEYSDKQVFTSDNPRNESPAKILNEMLEGLDAKSRTRVKVVEDRKQAIEVALENAGDKDLVAVLGKGHESQQIIAGERIEFSDANVCQVILAEIASERAAT